MYVLPEHRGKGIATALCRVVEAKARDSGISRLYLFTLDQEPLYARLGWKVLEHVVWHERDCVIMVKDLPMRPSG